LFAPLKNFQLTLFFNKNFAYFLWHKKIIKRSFIKQAITKKIILEKISQETNLISMG